MVYIFDFDGTLVDTATDVALAFQEAFRQNNISVPSKERIIKLIGKNLDEIVKELLEVDMPESVVLSIKNTYKNIYNASKKENTKPFDGISALLLKLVKKGYKIAINSNKPEEVLINMAKQYFPEIEFDAIVGYATNRPSKPDPYGVELIKTRVDEEKAIYIGDGLNDLLTAKNSKIPCVYVTWGPLIIKNSAEYTNATVNSVSELHELLN